MIKLRQKDIDRFWAKVDVCGPDDCWEWLGHISHRGYGRYKVKGRKIHAHRIAFLAGKLKQPGQLNVCHHCDNPRCCNPRHLFLGTQRDNMQDCVQKGRHKSGFGPGEKHPLSILTEKQVREIKIALKNYHFGLGKELAARYGVSPQLICNIRKNIRWGHIHA